MSERRRELLWLALALAVVLAGFFDIVFLGRAFVGFDHAIEYLPTWKFQRESIVERFELPLWDPRCGAGTPLLAAMFGGALDPVRWAFYPLPCVTGYCLHMVFLHLLAAAGAFRLARALGARPAVAAFAAILLGAGGPLRSLGGFEKELASAAWVPWFLLVTVSFARSPSLEKSILAGGVMGLIVLAGGPEYALACGVLFFAATHWRAAIELKSGERRARVLLRLYAFCAVAGVLSALLSLGVLLPARELTQISTRKNGFPVETCLSHATSAIDLLTLVFPDLLGNTARESWTLGKALVPGYSYFLPVLYPGALAVLLVPLAPYSKSRAARGLLAVLLLALVFSIGKSGFLATFCFEVFSPLRYFRFPYKAWSFAAPALAVLAGLGLERVLQEGAGKKARRALLVAAASGMAASLVGGWLLVFPEGLQKIQQAWLDNSTSLRVEANHLILEHAAWVLFVRGLVVLAFAVALQQLCEITREKRVPLLFLLCCSAVLDLTLVARTATPTIGKDFYEKPPYFAQFMQPKDGEPPPRFYPSPLVSSIPEEFLFDLGEEYWGEYSKEKLRENLATFFGLYQVHSYNPGFLERTNWLYAAIEDRPRWARAQFLAESGVQFVVSNQALENPELVFIAKRESRESDFLYRIIKGRPSYYVMDNDGDAVSRQFEVQGLERKPAYDSLSIRPEERAYIPTKWGEPHPRAVRVVDYQPRRVELALPANIEDGSYLIAHDAYEPRWRAYVDDQLVPVEEFLFTPRSIPLKKGARRVVMEYDATLARGAFAAQAASWTLAALVLALLARRQRTRTTAVP